MKRAVVVSFEDEIRRVIYAKVRGENIIVDDALVLKDEQFDDFLLKEKTKEFIIVSSFKDFFQETILVPPTKKKFIKMLLEVEIKKRSQFKDFSFLYVILGEKIVEHRRMKEVFVFAVKNEDIKAIIDRFILQGKVVKAIYPDIFSIANLVDSKMSFLCISETNLNKNMFLIKNGAIQFIRVVQSKEKGIRDIDIQSINMTINYCRQTLKINPDAIMLLGSLCGNYNVTTDTSIPIASCLPHRMPLIRDGSLYLDFNIPLSALFIPKERDINLLTKEYKNLFRTSLFLRYATALFLALTIIGTGYIGYRGKNIIELKNRLDFIKENLPDVRNTLTTYNMKRIELAGYMPFVTSLRNAAAIPDMRKFLSLLSELKTDNIRIDYMSITTADDILHVELKGSAKTDDYVTIQTHYQKFIDSMASLKCGIKSQGLNFRDKSFHVEITWGFQKIGDFPGRKSQ